MDIQCGTVSKHPTYLTIFFSKLFDLDVWNTVFNQLWILKGNYRVDWYRSHYSQCAIRMISRLEYSQLSMNN